MAAQRITGLDIIRSLAILAVVFAHSSEYLLRLINVPHIGGFLHSCFDGTHYDVGGLLGVELFFVLSGFLIGNILIKAFIQTDTFAFRDVRNFWVRRWFRTLPLYWLILTINIILYRIMDLRSHEMNKAFDYFFLQNLWYPHPLYFFGEAWSLSVEEWFYLTLPVTMFICALVFRPSNKKKFLLRVFLGYLSVFLLIRFVNAFHPINGADQDIGIRKVVVFRLDAVMYGVLIAYFNYYHSVLLNKLKNYLLAIGVVGVAVIVWMINDQNINIVGTQKPVLRFCSDAFLYLVLPFFFCLWLPFANNIPTIKNKYVSGFFTHISKISYSMYLVHYSLIFIPFFTNMKPVSMPLTALYYLLYWTIVIVLSTALYKYYEQPAMKLRERFTVKEK